MRNLLKKLILLSFGILLFVSIGPAQIRETGSILGNVTDMEGVPLPGVRVTVESPSLIGGARSLATDSRGFYKFASLSIGVYKIKAEIAGFQTVLMGGIALHANLTLTVDLKLPQAALEQEVQVEAAAPTVDIKSSSTGTVIMTDELLTSIPTAKSFEAILNLAPGTDFFTSYGSGYASPNRYQFDGVEVSSPLWGGINFAPDFNVIKEATVQGLGLPAEFGNFTGAIVTAVTKSGSNKFSVFNELRYNGKKWNSQNLGSIPDEEFYDPSSKEQEFSSDTLFDLGIQLGGQLIQDKLWFFIAGEYDQTRSYPLGTPVVVKYWNPRLFGKFTYEIDASNKVNASLSHHNDRGENILAGPSFPPGIDLNNFFPGWLFNFSWTSIFSPTTFLDVKFGYNWKRLDQTPTAGIDLAGHYDLFTGTYTVNFPFFMNGISETFHPSAHLSHYIPEFLKGSHDLKVGVEAQFFKTLRGGGYPGGETFYDYDGAPLLKYVQQPYNNDNYFRSIMGFVQDTWTLYKRLTLNLGFRYDNYWYKIPSPTVGVVYKNGNISPRLGLTYDLLGDRKNLLKLFYGHYYEGLFGNFFANLEDRYSDLIAYSWDGAEYVEFMRTKYEKLYEIDPNVKHPYLREISGGYERELFKDASLTLNFYYRFLGRTLGAVNTGAKYKKVTIANPGPDGIPGTSDDQGTLDVYDQLNPGQDKYLITNPKKGMSESMIDDIKKTMYGFEVIFNKRLSKRWQMIASYHYTKAKGNTDNVLSYLGTNPNSFVNAYGESAYYYGQPHQFKFQGTVLLPLDINLGINAQYISGQITQPYFYTVLSQGYSYLRGEPPGKTRTDPRTDFDIRFEKRFPVLNGNLSLMADVFNLFNTHETPFAWNRWNMYGPDYDKITSVKAPRTFRIGLRFVY